MEPVHIFVFVGVAVIGAALAAWMMVQGSQQRHRVNVSRSQEGAELSRRMDDSVIRPRIRQSVVPAVNRFLVDQQFPRLEREEISQVVNPLSVVGQEAPLRLVVFGVLVHREMDPNMARTISNRVDRAL